MSVAVDAVRDMASVQAVPRRDVRLILAVAVAGSAAAALATPAFWLLTLGVVALLMLASHKGRSLGDSRSLRWQHLSAELRRTIQTTLVELPDGDAKLLLDNVVERADALFAPRTATFDEQWEHDTRDRIHDLVAAACGVASDVARLDRALALEGSAAKQLPIDGLEATRALFIGRLRDAASSLAALYTVGVESGTPASDRVGELVQAIRADVALTSHAQSEIANLLRA